MNFNKWKYESDVCVPTYMYEIESVRLNRQEIRKKKKKERDLGEYWV